ncbi:MAG TPA: tyrosine-protein phosphatase [Anaerolineae bacterium]|nr:tyrosine-protein phosphatase [Anaerolineae bacterium]
MKTVNNFRDFGSYPTQDGRWLRGGQLYRSGDLDQLRGPDLKTIQALQLKTIVDLRAPRECKNGTHASLGARRVSLPFDIERDTRERLQPLMTKKNVEPEISAIISQTYAKMVDQVKDQLGEIFRLLLCAESYPVLIHCRAGKDRTGFACALIQLTLGLDPQTVLADYLKSNEFVLPRVRQMMKYARMFSLGRLPTENLALVYIVKEQYLCTALEKIEHCYGGLTSYLEQCGVGAPERAALQALLLESK